jgi:hypothetical protein
MTRTALLLSIFALIISGVSLLSGGQSPESEAGNASLKSIQEEVSALRKDLYAMKNGAPGEHKPLNEPDYEDPFNKPNRETMGLETEPPLEMPMIEGMHGSPTDEMMPVDPVMAAQIRSIIRQERQSNRSQRSGKRMQHFNADLLRRIGENATTTDLSEDERNSLAQLLENEKKSANKLRQRLRSGDLSRKETFQELKELRQDTRAIVLEAMGDEIADVIDQLSPLRRRHRTTPTSPQ